MTDAVWKKVVVFGPLLRGLLLQKLSCCESRKELAADDQCDVSLLTLKLPPWSKFDALLESAAVFRFALH